MTKRRDLIKRRAIRLHDYITMTTTVYHLEMRHHNEFCPRVAPAGFEASMVTPPNAGLNREMYQSVGELWEWTERLRWSEQDWKRYVQRECLETWVGELHGQTAGYFELEVQDEGNVQLVYFGLLPDFIGQGLGGPLLTAAIDRAWHKPQTTRVWVHTCTKDHRHALDNYRQRGFTVFKTERI